mmetsp:Transcript_18956/g.75587  ORF Transcript_18956/g.75587 Transcript_18956/m.75587 type:complete len:277 (-) Transcript_18956:1159-1989(-)
MHVAVGDGGPQPLRPRLAEGPRLAALGVVVRVAAEERRERRRRDPARHELGLGVAEEAARVGAGEREAARRQREQHGRRDREVVPARGVVARPHGPPPLRAREKRPRQHERAEAGVLYGRRRRPGRRRNRRCFGALRRSTSLRETLRGRAVEVGAVQVVPLAVLDAGEGRGGLGHGHFGPVEHRRLVHVVPRVQIFRRADVLVEGEPVGPPRADRRRREVEVARRPGPAPAVEVLGRARRLLDVVAEPRRFGVDGVVWISFDVRVDDGDHLAARLR